MPKIGRSLPRSTKKDKMEGTLKADKHFVTFAFDYSILEYDMLTGAKFTPEIGYVWTLCFIDDVSYMVDIMPMDEARHMYE